MAKKKILIGQKFGRLLVIHEAEKQDNIKSMRWFCWCECGNYKTISSFKLLKGITKSCGCLAKDTSSQTIKIAIKKNTKYTPEVSSASKVFIRYKNNDLKKELDFDLSLDDLLKISKMNCFYCGKEPSNKTNAFKHKENKPNKASKFALENGNFIYNGLDRIDNNKGHIKNNIVPCCKLCNQAKSSYNQSEFINKIKNIIVRDFVALNYTILSLPTNKYLLNTIKDAFKGSYTKPGDTISIEEFYSISQLPCYYCNIKFFNKKNSNIKTNTFLKEAEEQGWFYYNGLDRVDSKLTHTINNCVPCCGFCNWAKSNQTYNDFMTWVKRFQNYQEKVKNEL